MIVRQVYIKIPEKFDILAEQEAYALGLKYDDYVSQFLVTAFLSNTPRFKSINKSIKSAKAEIGRAK